MQHFIVTGTDTGVGKTVVSAMLMLALQASYWKPVQCGIAGGVDTKIVQKMTGLGPERFLPEAYILTEALSPHRAAELEGVTLDLARLTVPKSAGPLIIEGAGGLMVPLTRENLLINRFKQWHIPVILVAHTSLGTINHTLLSLEALWNRDIPVQGLVFTGPDNPDTIRTISDFSKTPVLGHMPYLEHMNAKTLQNAFDTHFIREDFLPINGAARS